MMSTNAVNKVVEKLSSVVSVVGAVKNIVKDSGYMNEGLEKNVSRLADTLHKRADELTAALNNGKSVQAGITQADLNADPRIVEILEKMVSQFLECVKELTEAGLDNATTWLLNWIKEKLG